MLGKIRRAHTPALSHRERGRRVPYLLAIALTILLFTPAVADTYHAPLDPSLGGGITGRVEPAEGLQTVIAVEPYEVKAYQATVDASTGAFHFRGLPPGEYDLLIKTVGRLYEGVTLETEPDQPPLPPAALAELARAVGRTFFAQEDYFNLKRIVRLTGTGERARLLGVHTRTRPTVDPAGNPIEGSIRRIDLVELTRTRDVWQIVTGRHLLRQEVPHGSPDERLAFTHSPALSGIVVGERMHDLGRIDLKKVPPGPRDRYASAEHSAD